jgi:uncharacterized protein (TIGR00369 family)
VEFRCQPDESAYDPIGLVHGGLVCTLLGSVAGCAVHSTLPAGVGYTSLEIKVGRLRPVRHGDGKLTATGRVTKPGRRAAFADGEVRDEDGRLIATASSTCLSFHSGMDDAAAVAELRQSAGTGPTGPLATHDKSNTDGTRPRGTTVACTTSASAADTRAHMSLSWSTTCTSADPPAGHHHRATCP